MSGHESFILGFPRLTDGSTVRNSGCFLGGWGPAPFCSSSPGGGPPSCQCGGERGSRGRRAAVGGKCHLRASVGTPSSDSSSSGSSDSSNGGSCRGSTILGSSRSRVAAPRSGRDEPPPWFDGLLLPRPPPPTGSCSLDPEAPQPAGTSSRVEVPRSSPPDRPCGGGGTRVGGLPLRLRHRDTAQDLAGGFFFFVEA